MESILLQQSESIRKIKLSQLKIHRSYVAISIKIPRNAVLHGTVGA